jgi:quinol monooxygenase YgiN
MPVTRPPRHRVASIFNFRVKDGCAARFMAEIEQAQDDSEDEPGLLRFETLQSHSDPNLFTFVDLFADNAAFQFHSGTAHIQRLIAATKDLLVAAPDGGLYTVHKIYDKV